MAPEGKSEESLLGRQHVGRRRERGGRAGYTTRSSGWRLVLLRGSSNPLTLFKLPVLLLPRMFPTLLLRFMLLLPPLPPPPLLLPPRRMLLLPVLPSPSPPAAPLLPGSPGGGGISVGLVLPWQ